MTKVLFKRLHEKAEIPTYAHESDAGLDLHCIEGFTLKYGEVKLVNVGFSMALEPGFEAQIRPRSGNALKKHVTVLNSPGTVDASYRGEVGVLLHCVNKKGTAFNAGDRIAQMVICPIEHAMVEEVDELPETLRGSGGFGSSGN